MLRIWRTSLPLSPERENVETTLRAFAQVRPLRVPHQLVITCRRVKNYLEHIGWKKSDFEGVHFTGFIPHELEPAWLVPLGGSFLDVPSFYEGCGGLR